MNNSPILFERADGIARLTLNRPDNIAVIGVGAMGAGTAQIAAQAGHPLLLRRKVASDRTCHAA